MEGAPILVLDEATNALYADGEEKVQEALEPLTVGRTTFVIAHRLSTIRAADRIALFREGAIAEVGTHDELLRLDGAYAALVRKQLRGFTSSAETRRTARLLPCARDKLTSAA